MICKKAIGIFLIFLLSACASHSEKRNIGQVIDDQFISVKLKTKFMKDDLIKSKDIDIKVRKGTVTLKGEVDNHDQINKAIEISEMQKGVKEVKAYLVLKEFGRLPNTRKVKKRKTLFLNKRLQNSNSEDDLQEQDLENE